MTNDEIISAILEREGGSTYTDHPADKGGPTKFGVTQAALAAYRGRPVTPNEVRDMTEAEARAIYSKKYLEGPGFLNLHSVDLRACLVDYAVHSGPSAAIKALQRVLKLTEDGDLGPLTLREANSKDGRRLSILLCCDRVKFLGRLITKNSSQAVFAAGWLRRVAELIEGIA